MAVPGTLGKAAEQRGRPVPHRTGVRRRERCSSTTRRPLRRGRGRCSAGDPCRWFLPCADDGRFFTGWPTARRRGISMLTAPTSRDQLQSGCRYHSPGVAAHTETPIAPSLGQASVERRRHDGQREDGDVDPCPEVLWWPDPQHAVRRRSGWVADRAFRSLAVVTILGCCPGLPGWVSRRLGGDVLQAKTALPDRLAASGRAVVWRTDGDADVDGSRGSGSGRAAADGRGAGVPGVRDGGAGRAWLGAFPVAAPRGWEGGAAEGACDRAGDGVRDGRRGASPREVQGAWVRGDACAGAAAGAVPAAG